MQPLFDLSQLQAERSRRGQAYLEFVRIPAMSVGLYVLPAGGTDKQQPHREDEIYYVVSGRGRMGIRDAAGAERDFAVMSGQILFVPARQEHRFHSIAEELTLLVVFGPAESSE